MFPSNMISAQMMPNGQFPMNPVYQFIQPPLAQAQQPGQPDLILTQGGVRQQQSVIHARTMAQAVEGGFNYVNGDLHNTQYSYILTPATGPNAHQQAAATSHVPPAASGNASGAGGAPTQQYVDYSSNMSMAAGYMTAAPQAAPPAANIQSSTSSSQLIAPGQYAPYPLPGQQIAVDSAVQTANSNVPAHSKVDPSSQLWKDLQRQLEYYFSPQNLTNDKFLRERMDAEGYVEITLVANFNKVVSLTTDLQLVIDVLRDSKNVQVDENGSKVRSLVNSGMLILREIPENTPVEEVRQLFHSDRCPPLISCHFYDNNNWLARFETHDDATRAYTFLRESGMTFRGQPIHARLKNPHGAPHGIKSTSSEGVTSPTAAQPRPIASQYPTTPVPSQHSSAPQLTMPPQQHPPQPASQPVTPQTAVYQQQQQQQQQQVVAAANQATRVYTPQPAPPQMPTQLISQTIPSGLVGPPTMQTAPPPTGVGAHQLPPTAAVQLLQPQPNFTLVPNQWPEQFIINYPFMQLTRQAAPMVYHDIGQRMIAAYPDVRFRPPARQAVMHIPVVTQHPGFNNAPGATPNAGVYATPIRPRRDSNSRIGAPRPSSGSNRYEYSMSRQPHQHTPIAASSELTSPITIDVASSTDAALATDTMATGMPEQVVMPMGHIDAGVSAVHQQEMPVVMEQMPRRGPTSSSWRHGDQGPSRPGARPNRRGGRHQEDTNAARPWNAREQPAELQQKFNFEATSFPPLTSAHTSADVEMMRHSSPAGGSTDVDHESQQMLVAGAVSIDNNVTRDTAMLAESLSAVCNVNDGNGGHISGAMGGDLSPAESRHIASSVSPARPSYAQMAQRRKDQPSGQPLMPHQSGGGSDSDLSSGDGHLAVDMSVSMSAPPPSQPPRHSYHQSSDMQQHHHHAAGHQMSHYQNDSTDRHMPARRGGRGGAGASRPYRMFFPSDNSSSRGGGGRWRGGAPAGHSHDVSGRIERTIPADEQAQIPTS